ncbi:hypothetical protein NLN82_26830 [Citrobacter portucalensis]|uniref:hypothetical protein n=1 Tax=Citrobacter portucalensis TaxID=1639133 RepID=UPI00226BB004|nr:hypothetical protein [Citrobacter portucalensis]MCX9039618.1 hypothetical protein [Citrobacter portucalensis]
MKRIMIITEDVSAAACIPEQQVSPAIDFGQPEKADVLQQGEHLTMYRKAYYCYGIFAGYVYYGASSFIAPQQRNENDTRRLVSGALSGELKG